MINFHTYICIHNACMHGHTLTQVHEDYQCLWEIKGENIALGGWGGGWFNWEQKGASGF